MRRRGEPIPHELDGKSTQELHETASGFDEVGWEAQRQGFVELRDLSGGLADGAQRALARLRETWNAIDEVRAMDESISGSLASGIVDAAALSRRRTDSWVFHNTICGKTKTV